MRVAVFTDNDFNKINGVTTSLTALLDHAPADVQARIYTAAALGTDAPDYLALASPGVPLPFYRELRMHFPKFHEYLRTVREDHVEILHVTTPGPVGLTALWVARETGLPLVGSFHTNLGAYTSILSGSSRLGQLMNGYMRWFYGRCCHVLVPSAATRDALTLSGWRQERLTIWPRGVDASLFSPAKRSPLLRRQWRADEDHPVLLYVGRLSREKGLELLPVVMERLRTLNVRCRLVVAGDGPLRQWLAQHCPEASLTGPLGREQVAEVFASADVFVFPSRTDTAGNVVLEAQAAGLPVLVSDAGGPRENIVPGMTGLICSGEDGRSWARAAARLLSHPEARAMMATEARRYALSRQWEVALQPLFDTYRRVDVRHPTNAAVVTPAA